MVDVVDVFIFVVVPDTSVFLKNAFQHPTLYRSVYRFYIIQHTLDQFDLSVFASQDLPSRTLRIMVHPREQEKSMIDLIPENINLHPKNFTDLLSVVYLKGKVYMGLAPKELFFYPGSLEQILKSFCAS